MSVAKYETEKPVAQLESLGLNDKNMADVKTLEYSTLKVNILLFYFWKSRKKLEYIRRYEAFLRCV